MTLMTAEWSRSPQPAANMALNRECTTEVVGRGTFSSLAVSMMMFKSLKWNLLLKPGWKSPAAHVHDSRLRVAAAEHLQDDSRIDARLGAQHKGLGHTHEVERHLDLVAGLDRLARAAVAA
jgi:hypothetical protein